MIIQEDFYSCPKCLKSFSFDNSQPFSKICPKCKVEMNYGFTLDVDTEKAAAAQAQYERDMAIMNGRGVECPYCKSTNTQKITSGSRILSTGLFGLGSKKIGKQWHCNKCKSDF